MTTDTMIPYVVEIAESELADLKLRLGMASWPDEVASVGWDYGVPRGYVQDLVAHWRDGYEDAHTTGRPAGPTTTPTGVAIFAEDFQSIRKFADRDHGNVVSWNRYPSGSHFATRDATDLLICDIRRFYRALR
jgi:hypothetical protein